MEVELEKIKRRITGVSENIRLNEDLKTLKSQRIESRNTDT